MDKLYQMKFFLKCFCLDLFLIVEKKRKYWELRGEILPINETQIR